jgi:uncharacterized protein (TIGR00251 family)
MAIDPAIRESAEGTVIACHIQPRASRTRVAGRHGDAVKIQVAAPPVDDAANQELVHFLRRLLRRPAGAIVLAAGEHSRRKTILVRGMAADAVAAALGLAP